MIRSISSAAKVTSSVKFFVDSSVLYDTEYKLHDKYFSMALFMSVPGPSRIEHTIKDKCGFFSNATLDHFPEGSLLRIGDTKKTRKHPSEGKEQRFLPLS